MVFMALDHVRYFFTDLPFQPEELARTNLGLFLTRWVTHFCAPGFFLLAGFGIYLYASTRSRTGTVRDYLLLRGAILVVLELTIVGFAWVFRPGYSFAGVIWAFGWSFILMAPLLYAPRRLLLAAAVGVLLLHDLWDGVVVHGSGWLAFLWRVFCQPGPTSVPGVASGYFVLYPVLPWLAILVLGFGLGHLYREPSEARRRAFVRLGWALVAGFVLLRTWNLYGNPPTLFVSEATSGLFSMQPEIAKTVINFLNPEKYPPSLQYTLMTLGPIFLWLGYSRIDGAGSRAAGVRGALVVFGRVPLFFYLLHLYLIHLLALATGWIAGQPVAWLLPGPSASGSRTPGFGFDLWVIYAMWLVVTVILYYACRAYMAYKRTHDGRWLKYL